MQSTLSTHLKPATSDLNTLVMRCYYGIVETHVGCADGRKDTHCCVMPIKEPFRGRGAPDMTIWTQRTAGAEKIGVCSS